RLRTSKTLPTTSSAIQGEFLQLFEELCPKVDGIVVVAISGSVGAAYSTALAARDMVSGAPIEVIDTRTALMAQGFCVLAGAKVAAAGGSMEEVCAAVTAAIGKVNVFWMMDTLDYLRRGGRISLPQAVLAGWLQVKPVMTFADGVVTPLARTRTRPKAMAKLVDLAGEAVKGTGPLHLAIMHAGVPMEAKQLEEMVKARFPEHVELITAEVTPVIGTHTGPGTLALACYEE
ncbi:DegV family protein, partial [Chloroflexota bacterium]